MNLNSNEKPKTKGKRWLVLGCVLAAIAVGSGAIGAHLLEDWLKENFTADYLKRQELWETAARYQMYHAIGLILVGMMTSIRCGRRKLVGGVMFAGVVLFSGSLYAYVLTDIKPLVAIVPLGGLSMIMSWLMFAWFIYTSGNEADKDQSGAEN